MEKNAKFQKGVRVITMKRELIKDIYAHTERYDGKTVTLGGWVRNIRDSFFQLPVTILVHMPLLSQNTKLGVDGCCQPAQVRVPGGNVDEGVGICC